MSARVVASRLIQNISNGSRIIAVEVVTQTDAWIRPSEFPTKEMEVKAVKFVQEALDNGKLRPDTTSIAIQDSEHTSPSDERDHFTALELNVAKEITAKRHFVNEKDKDVPQK